MIFWKCQNDFHVSIFIHISNNPRPIFMFNVYTFINFLPGGYVIKIQLTGHVESQRSLVAPVVFQRGLSSGIPVY